jgi:ribosomal-protein-serine acetyltransferase
MRPAGVLVRPRVVLRRLWATDADEVGAAVEASLDHLRPWMPWAATEPLPHDERVELLRGFERAWQEGTDLHYGIDVDGELVGVCGLHDRIGPGAREIGYWVRPDRTRRGYATAAADALRQLAFTLPDVTAVEIHHDVANAASGRIPQRLGFHEVRVDTVEVLAPGQTGRSRIWRLESPPDAGPPDAGPAGGHAAL